MASDSDSDQDFVTFGTPLEPLEEDEPLRKPIPVHEQTVKDEKGRYQRFHGAFTGGFSAGYFNTVGTKEGWTPSTFVSSRQQKAGRQNARPEDFMDEEDLGEHGIAPRQIITTADFASGRKDLIGDKARAITSLSAPIPGDTVLEDLVAPARSSMGVELLGRMGWKDGQGVGPRVKRRLCKQEADPATRVLGSALPPNGSSESRDEEDDEFVPENVTFAPKDVTPIDFTPKVDLHGLGYRGLNPLAALRGGPGAGNINLFTMDSDRTTNLFGEDRKGQRRRGGVAGQGFGVGAMEDDDEDIYHRDTMSNYDAVLGGEEPGDGLYGWTAPQQYNRKKKVHSKDAAYLGKILEGFTLGSDKMETKTIFPPPDLPRDFRPVHYFRPVVDMSSVSPMVAQALLTSRGHMAQEEPSKGGRHQLDSAQRRELLGETALQGPSSVFDLLKVEDRERLSGLRRPSSDTTSGPRPPTEPIPGEAKAAVVAAGVAAAAAKASAQKALSSRFAPPAEQQQEALSVWSGPAAQAQAGQTFKPFERTAHKQARYDLYIDKLKQGDRDALELSLDPAMTEWERGRERDEFVRAALLYKPSSSSLSCRFTRGKHDDAVEADTVEVTRDQENDVDDKQAAVMRLSGLRLCTAFFGLQNDVDDKQAAVMMKMFGKLTRDSFEWHPDKLLCKRFNVPDPYPGSGFVGMPKVKRDKFSVFNFLTVSESPTASASPAPQAVKPSEPGKRSRWDVSGQAGALEKEKDPLSEFLSVARIEASGSGPDTSTTDGPTTDPTVEPDTEKEEEEEESRPPMDLFKAIFASSSDEKSSSSSEGESEEEEEEGVRSKAGTGPQISNQFNVNTSPPAPPVSVSATPSQHTDVMFKMPSGPAAAPPPQDQEMEEEEFGPRLPPPSSTLTERRPAPTPSAKNDKHKKKCKEKYKAKKHGKHKKDKKQKKKHKRHKHKGKQKKSGRKEESSDSSSEGSDGNSQEEGGGVSTEELLRRLKSIRGKNLQ
ncbi:G patch domain-containing protein 1 isoform X3 [Coregonus clupeaformis]|uniref:G patch domain-containing protein 1 isoform X3 n=1 Tax=Coregonus clupeaformis TaxID=59861 RepID=UPI001E1C9490|nr:G patch domain-containing protein 1 isoform X3 [Coregonus clupeaformis]